MFDLGSSIVPGNDSNLGAQTGEGDEVLGLGHVHWLVVYTWRHLNQGSSSVGEGNGINGFLHRLVITTPVLCHLHNHGPHFPLLIARDFVQLRTDKQRLLFFFFFFFIIPPQIVRSIAETKC